MFWSKWSFSGKLFALLIFPLVVQLILFIALCAALSHAQSLSERQFQEQQLISALDQVLLDRGTTFGGILHRSVFPSELTLTQKSQNIQKKRIAQNLARVKQSVVLDTDTKQSIEAIESSYAAEASEQARLKNLSLFEKMEMLGVKTRELQALHDQIAKKLDANELAYADDRRRIGVLELTLAVGFLLDLCAAFVSLFLFNRNLKTSLSALTENSQNVSSDSELPHRLNGVDELCIIDDALHMSHMRLLEAKQQRQAINAMIAHDVRTPLMAIGLLTHKLSTELSKNENPLTQEVQRLQRNIESVNNHVEDLLVVEKLEAGKIELKFAEVNLKALLADVCSTFADMAIEKNVTIKLNAVDYVVMADAARLSQVVQNYLSNAIRFSPPSAEVLVQLVVSPESVAVRVKDAGGGIKQSDQARLFSKFFQVGSAQNDKGFGLGLSICKKLIEMHGGEVGVTSRPLAGSTFWFTLPVDDID